MNKIILVLLILSIKNLSFAQRTEGPQSVVPLVSGGTSSGGSATNAIAFNNGSGTNTTLYGLTLVSNSITLWHNGTSTPYSTIDGASTASASGDSIVLGPGTYAQSNRFYIPTNGAIIGAGPGSTVIINYHTNSANAPYPLCRLTDNSYLSSLTISNFYATNIVGTFPNAVYQACCGVHRNANDGAYNASTLYNVKLFGGTDAIYVRHTNTCSGLQVISCVVTSGWDCSTLFDSGLHDMNVFNSIFVSRKIQGITQGGHCIANDTDAAQIVRFFNSYLGLTNSSGSQVNIPAGINNRYEFYNCTITNSSPGATVDIDGNLGNTIVIQNTVVSPTRINDGAGGMVGILYSPMQTTKIQFGGDVDDGDGPTITTTFPTASDTIFSGIIKGNGSGITNLPSTAISTGSHIVAAGTTNLTAGKATINSAFANITNAFSLVFLQRDTTNTTIVCSNIVADTSFQIVAGSATTNTVSWSIIKP